MIQKHILALRAFSESSYLSEISNFAEITLGNNIGEFDWSLKKMLRKIWRYVEEKRFGVMWKKKVFYTCILTISIYLTINSKHFTNTIFCLSFDIALQFLIQGSASFHWTINSFLYYTRK